ncbi:MAG: hypothetical protein SFW67_05625 [Myxococcaceae bacterium]|nr:hypothetical protein [Myxococcaceae bacterium]
MNRLVLVLLFSSCGASTDQVRRTFPLEVLVRAPTAPTDSGWTLSDVRGVASFASVRFFEGQVLITRRRSPLDWLVSTAHAHPGHYEAGAALGELLEPLELNLAGGEPATWGTVNAVTGRYGSVELGWATGVRVLGTATKGSESVRFDTGVLAPTKPLSAIAFEHTMTTAEGTVRLELDLGVLLSRVDFGKTLSTPDAQGLTPLDRASPAFNGFERGVTDTTSYRFTWQSN